MSARLYALLTASAFFLTLAGYLVFSVKFVQTDTFVTHSSNISEIISSYRFANLADIDADVVFVGDSTAVVGVNPEIVSEVSGLSSYNLSLTVGSFIAVGDIMLDRYLEQNRPPKAIVLYIGPWTTPTKPDAMVGTDDAFNLQYPSWEATFAVINFASGSDVFDYFTNYPDQLTSLMRWSVTQFWRGFDSGPAKRARLDAAIERHRGWLPLETGVVGLATFRSIPDGCRYRPWELTPDTDFISGFRRRYETAATKVLVFVAPIPDCDQSIAFLTKAYEHLADRAPSQLPHRYFAYDTPRHNHLLEVGSEVNSREVGTLLKQLVR